MEIHLKLFPLKNFRYNEIFLTVFEARCSENGELKLIDSSDGT